MSSSPRRLVMTSPTCFGVSPHTLSVSYCLLNLFFIKASLSAFKCTLVHFMIWGSKRQWEGGREDRKKEGYLPLIAGSSFTYYLIFPLLFSARVLESYLKSLSALLTLSSLTLQPSVVPSLPENWSFPFKVTNCMNVPKNQETPINSHFPWPPNCM